MQRILFAFPGGEVGTFPELFTTVRRGGKWAELAKVGDKLELARTEGEVYLGEARVEAIVCGPLDQISAELLGINHDPSCRTPEGILAGLRRAYGDDVATDEPVTVLTLRLTA